MSLTSQAVQFLNVYREASGATSLSGALEALIDEKRREAKRRHLEKAISRFYDGASDEEFEAERAWGAFAEREFTPE